MPANLTPQYHDAEERFKAAQTPADKVEALEEMLRIIPKHKGTEKMQADLKRRLSKLRNAARKQKGSGASQRPFYHVDREGAGRVAIAGPANAGKSTLLSTLTRAHPEVADYPFTTRVPQPGMMAYEDVQIQLVDLPPLAEEVLEPWQLALIEQSEVALLLFDVSDPLLLDQSEFVLDRLAERNLVVGRGERPRWLVLGNKVENDEDSANFEAWTELFGSRLPARRFSAVSQQDLEWLRRELFQLLGVVRAYTKAPGKKRDPSDPPYVLKRGSSVTDLATMIHRDLGSHFKFARLWSQTVEGLAVERDHVLDDGDLVEIHE